MKKFFLDNKINFLFLFISFLCLAGIIGIGNISFYSTRWLYNGGDTTVHQLGWYFFKNDIWRFPLGSNPNYGGELGNSIVFSDSIPILALLFKSFRSFIPGNFQYFSFWYFICFFLQLFFSFKILKKFTNSVPYSLIGSIFFLIAPIFIMKLITSPVPALAGQWLLLFTLYLGLTQEISKAKLSWVFLIIFSILINFYFTAVIIVVYSFLRIFNLKFEKKNFHILIKDFLIIFLLSLLTLYVVGYFEIRMVDTLAIGFGRDKLNLLSIFDPTITTYNNSWSWFLPDIKLSKGEEFAGFNYLGLGRIIMLFFAFSLFLNKNYKINLLSIKSNKKIKAFILVSFILTFWALSNKISFGSSTLFEIPLNKYIFGILSIIRQTGRIFWIVSYFLLILSIIIIYKCFNEKKSILIITLFLIIQIADTSAGLKNYRIPPTNVNEDPKDQIWDVLFKKNKVLKTSFPINYAPGLQKFPHLIEKYNIKKTNLIGLGKMNREAAAKARYYLYNNFRKKNLETNTIYVVFNLNHLRHLHHIFKNENVGFFYRDDVWIMVMNEKERMNDNDIKKFKQVKPTLLAINEKENLNFKDNDSYYGFGWSHNFGKPGIWSEGPISTLFFRTEKNNKDLKLEISYRSYIAKKNYFPEFDVYVNNILNQNIKLKKNNQDLKIEILIKVKHIKNNEIKIDFNFKNLISPYEMFESPDSRKLGILIKNVKINPV